MFSVYNMLFTNVQIIKTFNPQNIFNEVFFCVCPFLEQEMRLGKDEQL